MTREPASDCSMTASRPSGTGTSRAADASGVGFALDRVPVAHGALTEEALNGGEDYELLFTTCDEARLLLVCADREVPPPIRIGTVTKDVNVRTLLGEPLPRGGWEHRL